MFGRIVTRYNPAISLANIDPNDPIYKYCTNKGKYNPNGTYIQMEVGCNTALPLSKTTNLNTSTNTTGISNAMKYSQIVNSYGTAVSSTSSAKKTCRIGGPTFSY
jgi:hypothetical protein